MSTYKFIKSREKMQAELFALWDQKEIYEFTFGAGSLERAEREICECLIDSEIFIIACKLRYFILDK